MVRTTTQKDRKQYYLDVWGFDPEEERIALGSGRFRYEAIFPLASDPPFHAIGVSIVARVDVSGSSAQNRIVFQRGKQVGEVTCIHTVVYQGSLQSIEQVGLATILRNRGRGQRLVLPPEEHFVALRSFVAGLADLGVCQALRAHYLVREDNLRGYPLQVNNQLFQQLLRALTSVAPRAVAALAFDLLLELLEILPADWFFSRLPLLEGQFNLLNLARAAPKHAREFTRQVGEVLLETDLAISLPKRTVLVPLFLSYGKQSVLAKIRQAISLTENLSTRTRAYVASHRRPLGDLLPLLAKDPSSKVRAQVARRRDTPREMISKLANDPSTKVRIQVARRRDLSPVLAILLSGDVSEEVRKYIYCRRDFRVRPAI